MKRSGFKIKPRKPLKRSPIRKGSKIRVAGHTDAKDDKKEIQRLLREIVMKRDRRCILYGLRCYNSMLNAFDAVVWQAEHLVERSNSASYADTRLVVLVCKNCHGWKHFTKSNHDQYDEWVRTKLSPERVKLWDAVRQDQRAHKTYKVDWKLSIVSLKQELAKLNNAN